MKSKSLWQAVVIALGLAGAVSINVYAAPGGNGGGGGGSAGTAAGALYGDLYVIERDGNGEPVLTTVAPTTTPGVTYLCQQPLAAGCGFLPLNGEKGDFNPELEDACAVQDGTLLQEVKFGRESVSRAPAIVIDKSYAEALKTINLATPSSDGRAIKLDPAGRISLCIAEEGTGTSAGMPINAPRIGRAADVACTWKTIDAPLENLGLYRAAMTSGCFGPVSEETVGEEGVRIIVTTELSAAAKGFLSASGLGHLVCGFLPPDPKADMLSAAVFLAAGADKSSPVTLDEIINVNNYLGVNTWTYTTVRKVKTLTIDYFDFKVTSGPGGWFGYTNGVDACDPSKPDNTAMLLTTHNNGVLFDPESVSVFGDSSNGVNLSDAAITVCRKGFPLVHDSALVVCDDARVGANPVYGTTADGIYGCGGANWFAQAAEDARKTIWYLHNWRLPVVAY